MRGVRGPFPGGGGGFYLRSTQRKKSQKSTSLTCPQVTVLSLLRMCFLEASPQFVVGCPLNVFLCTCGSYHCFLAGQTATYCINCRILFLDNRPKGSYVYLRSFPRKANMAKWINPSIHSLITFSTHMMNASG